MAEKRRHSQGECCGAIKGTVSGNPDEKHISTSYVERQNLTMRMGMRHCTRLTNGFSKKVENHAHALAIYFMHYNFARIHSSLRVSPAMAAGGTDKLWSLEDVAALVRSKRAAAEETRPLQKASSKLTHYLSGQYILRDQHLFTTRCE